MRPDRRGSDAIAVDLQENDFWKWMEMKPLKLECTDMAGFFVPKKAPASV